MIELMAESDTEERVTWKKRELLALLTAGTMEYDSFTRHMEALDEPQSIPTEKEALDIGERVRQLDRAGGMISR